MNDIVERLRARAKSLRGMGSIAHVDADTDDEAADEITALRAENERLQAFADAFGKSSMYYPGCGCHICEKYRAALAAQPAPGKEEA